MSSPAFRAEGRGGAGAREDEEGVEAEAGKERPGGALGKEGRAKGGSEEALVSGPPVCPLCRFWMPWSVAPIACAFRLRVSSAAVSMLSPESVSESCAGRRGGQRAGSGGCGATGEGMAER